MHNDYEKRKQNIGLGKYFSELIVCCRKSFKISHFLCSKHNKKLFTSLKNFGSTITLAAVILLFCKKLFDYGF